MLQMRWPAEAVAARTPAAPWRRRQAEDDPATVRAARRLNRAAGVLALSVLADSAIEHYRGSFKNKAMFTPLVVSALTLAASAHGTADSRAGAHRVRDAVYALGGRRPASLGTGFHIYNVGKQAGRLGWQNLFYRRAARRAVGDPAVGPARLLLRARARQHRGARRRRCFGLPAGRALAAVTGAGLLGTDRRGRAAAFPRRLSRSVHVRCR